MSDLTRARRLLARPGAWIETAGEGYAVRVGADRRARVLAMLDEPALRQLIEAPGLRARPGGGWTMRRPSSPKTETAPQPGRPGVIEGERAIIQPDGSLHTRRANLAHSPVAWLARRLAPDGRPWLSATEVAAAERLGREAETALSGPSLTMRWDALPRSGGGSATRSEPAASALSAGRRVETALAACGPGRAMVEAVCIRASALQAAETGLGLRRREGKHLLKRGLGALARHYGLS
jgi:hypothetical protein